MLDAHGFDGLKERTAENVRRCPSGVRERKLLFELLCLDGEWSRALQHLQAWAMLEPNNESDAHLFRMLIQHEISRGNVFAGRCMPSTFHPAPAWIDALIRANLNLSQGNLEASDTLRAVAFDVASATRGDSLQMGEFEWLADSDTRLGPVCELVVSGGYYWAPFDAIKAITLGPIMGLTDLMWRSAIVRLHDTTVLRCYMPIRYPGSEGGAAAIKLASETRWHDIGATGVIGLGQKTWSTDKGDFGLLDIGECRFFLDDDI